MSRKPVLATTLMIVLIGMFGVTLFVALKAQRVEASGTIYIKPDGSVEGTTDISSVDNAIYTFTDNIYDEIVVQRDNIGVDGAGYTLQGTGSGYGIELTGRSNVTIKNMKIKTFGYGIAIHWESSNNTVSRNTITNNVVFGILLHYHSNYNSISGNKITNNTGGMQLTGSSNYNTISGNNITNHSKGIQLSGAFEGSNNNSVYENNITANDIGVYLFVASNNKLYHNNFIDNIQQVYIQTSGYANFWDGGVGKGNYWSDYEDKYPDAEEIDGIWDTPYKIDDYNQDNYPIVPEFPTWTSMLLILIMLTVAIAICKRRLLRTPTR